MLTLIRCTLSSLAICFMSLFAILKLVCHRFQKKNEGTFFRERGLLKIGLTW